MQNLFATTGGCTYCSSATDSSELWSSDSDWDAKEFLVKILPFILALGWAWLWGWLELAWT